MLRVGYRIRLASGKGPDREDVITALIGSMLRVRCPARGDDRDPRTRDGDVLVSSGDDAPPAVPPGPSAPKRATAQKAAPKKVVPKTTAATKTATKKKKAVPSKAAPKKTAAKTAAAKKAAPTKKSGDWENGVRQEERADQTGAAAKRR